MAYNNELRPRKRIADKKFFGKFGNFDFRDGILWKDMPMEALVAFSQLHKPATVEEHLIGAAPKKKAPKKVIEKPSTNDNQAE